MSAVTTPGAAMTAEIAEQPLVFARLVQAAADVDGDIEHARRGIAAYAPRFVVLAARGSSDHAALYGKYLAEIRCGLPAGLASLSSLTVYDARPTMTGVLFLAVSQSGGSPDLLESVQRARSAGALTVALTNAPSSPVARAAQLHVDLRAGPEVAVAATKTYTAELLALYLLLVGGDAAALPDAAARTLEQAGRAHEAAQRYRFASYLTTTARGYSYATAREAALKLMETAYLPAQAFSAADLLHGPLAMIDDAAPVIAVCTGKVGSAAMAPVLQRLRDLGADVLRIGPGGLPVDARGVPDVLLPALEILPLQHLAYRLATDRGANPDLPRRLNKITETW